MSSTGSWGTAATSISRTAYRKRSEHSTGGPLPQFGVLPCAVPCGTRWTSPDAYSGNRSAAFPRSADVMFESRVANTLGGEAEWEDQRTATGSIWSAPQIGCAP